MQEKKTLGANWKLKFFWNSRTVCWKKSWTIELKEENWRGCCLKSFEQFILLKISVSIFFQLGFFWKTTPLFLSTCLDLQKKKNLFHFGNFYLANFSFWKLITQMKKKWWWLSSILNKNIIWTSKKCFLGHY